ncbi:MAG: PAS domain-containing protein [Sulfurospirillaceae bacterium]|jgi:predicted transcriptional regulator YheO|nr:PAS domain-containing protein [Sulfurospirillaceae bacterium]MCK9546719.1 PAS domain-containing protein [Sulfurospirillaceae bacterium]MDY0238620.1 PAS domain-containing protein [Campylobacterales bacterium]NLM98445.1 hypothetical protein [Campylobacteraceae bacterium]
MNKKLKPYITLADALTSLFHPSVEVVLHDLKSKKVAYISNAFSSRRAGDKMIGAMGSFKKNLIGPYEKKGSDGRVIKAITLLLRDENEDAFGMLCINYDISLAKGLYENLKEFLNLSKNKEDVEVFVSQDWENHIDKSIDEFLKEKNLTLMSFKKDEKQELVNYLQSAGIFTIRNSTNYVSKKINISRATIYNWLKKEKSS